MPGIDWPYLMSLGFDHQEQWNQHADQRIQQAVEAACEAGFDLQGTPQGKLGRLY